MRTWRGAVAGLAMQARLLILLASLAFLGFAAPRAAQAHAALVSAEPSDGASLAAAPSSFALRFDEEVTPLALRVLGPDGAEVPLPGLPAPGTVLRMPLPEGLGLGVYLVSWRVVSADGHPVAGALAFGVGSAAAPAATLGENARARGWARLLQALRFVFYVALVVAPGGALFRLLVAEPPRRVLRGMWWAGLAGIAAAALSVGAFGGLLAEAPWKGLLDPAVWRLGAGVPLAASLGISAIGFGLVTIAAGSEAPTARWLGACGAIVVALGLPVAGHAATAEPRWIAATALTVHALVVTFWLGAFWPLRALLADREAVCAPAVERFSRLVLPAVAALLAAGITLAALRLHSFDDVFGSTYGWLVMAKLYGFVLLFALAAANRQYLTVALAVGRSGAAASLSRSILAEMAIAAMVLCVTTALVRTPPPTTTAGDALEHAHHPSETDATDGLTATIEADGLTALVQVSPGRAGPNHLAVTLGRTSGEALPPPPEVWASFEQPVAAVGPIRRRLRAEGGNRFAHDGPELALPGRWSIRIDVLISDFEQASLSTVVDLQPATP
jgi:copper transport protein